MLSFSGLVLDCLLDDSVRFLLFSVKIKLSFQSLVREIVVSIKTENNSYTIGLRIHQLTDKLS